MKKIEPMSFDHFESKCVNKHPLEEGLLVGQVCEGVSFEYLRGLMTLLTPLYCCMVERYSRWNGDKIFIKDRMVDDFNGVRMKLNSGTDMAFFPDDLYVIAKGYKKVYVLAFCKDKNNRFICCLKHSDNKKAMTQLINFIESHRNNCIRTSGNYLDMPHNNIMPQRDFFKKNVGEVEVF